MITAFFRSKNVNINKNCYFEIVTPKTWILCHLCEFQSGTTIRKSLSVNKSLLEKYYLIVYSIYSVSKPNTDWLLNQNIVGNGQEFFRSFIFGRHPTENPPYQNTDWDRVKNNKKHDFFGLRRHTLILLVEVRENLYFSGFFGTFGG